MVYFESTPGVGGMKAKWASNNSEPRNLRVQKQLVAESTWFRGWLYKRILWVNFCVELNVY